MRNVADVLILLEMFLEIDGDQDFCFFWIGNLLRAP